jgi:hypothetical protein
MIETDAQGRAVLRVPGAVPLAEAQAARRALLDALAAAPGPLAVGLSEPPDGVVGLQLALSAATSLEAAGRFAGFAADAPALLAEAIR